ncbi:acyltransferase family protein [Lacticaseibacillus kribbianus]|uniref:acyltransferase family protein n=1 Tax=Lacticaseibacillus kribbianus TaxID=2926292 RepID=UPI001CD7E5F5|nr:acyltransferase [Lacticaseibacillus kribbianus]
MPDANRPYLHALDAMRVFFICGVLLNHTTTAFIQQLTSQSAARTALLGTHLTIHFTRMGFMFLTGFVLTYRYRGTRRWGRFLARRLTATGIPYLAWNLLYLALAALGAGGLAYLARTAPDALLHGNQFYMYYLMITFQFYLVLPLVLRLLARVTRHGWLLAASFLAQLAVVTWIKYVMPGVDRSQWLWWCRAYGINFLSYQFYLLLGCCACWHRAAFTAWVQRHLTALSAWAVALGVVTVPYYFLNKSLLGLDYTHAVSPHQPFMLVYDTVVILAVFGWATRYAASRDALPRRLTALIHQASLASFGIYLDQTLVLALLRGALSLVSWPNWALTLALPVGYAFVVAGSLALAWAALRIRPLGVLVGRPAWQAADYPEQVVARVERSRAPA